MPNVRPWLPIALILFVALAVRLLAASWWESRLPVGKKFFFGDSESYWDLASDIAQGREYAYGDSRMFRTPGYPIVLAPLFWVAGDDPSVFLARVWIGLWGTAAVAGVIGLGWQLFGRTAGLVAGAMAAVYPEAIGASVFILSEAAFCPLMLGQLILAISTSRAVTPKSRWLLALAAGLVGGCAALVRPSWLLFTPFLLVTTCLVFSDRKKMLLLNSLQIAGLCLAMLPWWVRNYAVSGHFVVTSTEVGMSLLDGWNPEADGSSNWNVPAVFVHQLSRSSMNMPPMKAGLDFSKIPPETILTFPTEVELDHSTRNEALAWASENPRRVLELGVIKFTRMWNIWPNENEFRSWPMRIVVAATYVPLLVLVFLGLRRWGRQWTCWLLLAPAVYFTLLHMIFVSSIRYRLPPLLPLMAIAAAVIAVWVGEKMASDDTTPKLALALQKPTP